MKLIPLDKYGWPVERFRKRPITNAIRLMLHTRRIVTGAEWKRREAARHRSYAAFGSPTTGCAQSPK
jgi:hypothetical protein